MRRLYCRVSCVVISLVVAWLTLEIALRALGFQCPRVEVVRVLPDDRSAASWMRIRQPDLFYPTSEGWRLRPNLRVTTFRDPPITLSTNSLGLRNREIGVKRSPRIIFLGDSITLGRDVAEEDTFVRRVEASARQRGSDLEVINAGIDGASSRDEIALLKTDLLPLRPDLVVLCFFLNDYMTMPAYQAPLPPQPLSYSLAMRTIYERVGILLSEPQVLRRPGEATDVEMNDWRREVQAFGRASAGDYTRSAEAFNALKLDHLQLFGAAWSRGAWVLIERQLLELKRISAEQDFEVKVAVFPLEIQVNAPFLDDYPQRMIAATAERLGWSVIDLLPELRSVQRVEPRKQLYIPGDIIHYSAVGHEVVAQILGSRLGY